MKNTSQPTLKNGKKAFDPALGPHGTGFLIYSPDGHLCAELMNPDRPAWNNNAQPTDKEKVFVFDGFFAYCGRYEIDAERHGPDAVEDMPAHEYRVDKGRNQSKAAWTNRTFRWAASCHLTSEPI
jgi:hypothetical protein